MLTNFDLNMERNENVIVCCLSAYKLQFYFHILTKGVANSTCSYSFAGLKTQTRLHINIHKHAGVLTTINELVGS